MDAVRESLGSMVGTPVDDMVMEVALEIVQAVDSHGCPRCLEPLERNKRVDDA
jgi:hypothetical protein